MTDVRASTCRTLQRTLLLSSGSSIPLGVYATRRVSRLGYANGNPPSPIIGSLTGIKPQISPRSLRSYEWLPNTGSKRSGSRSSSIFSQRTPLNSRITKRPPVAEKRSSEPLCHIRTQSWPCLRSATSRLPFPSLTIGYASRATPPR